MISSITGAYRERRGAPGNVSDAYVLPPDSPGRSAARKALVVLGNAMAVPLECER
ncbi:hypothetical protein Pve01_07370 [Planomonospora venezuelensis]|nr:hypothetical protein Pve01_07370 [Planomonospora venezuelensis]